jgi:ABC-type transport system involved in multi-copper enzyme maturation permease subunit
MTTNLALLGLPPWVDANLHWVIAGLIVVIGLFVIGIKDLVRFSITRAWAISGVSFSESIRRRVLLITPLAILGIIIVSQLQKPVDEADAIRQTIKVAMFATGMVVCIVTIILACTNLPKEIDNRVIYTVVTKPTTRLEIVVGKVLGFARVSATILLIMGVFTWGYLALRAWNMGRMITTRLERGDYTNVHKQTLEHYQRKGLLAARQYSVPAALQVYSRLPDAGSANTRWVFGSSEQDIVVPFMVSPEQLGVGQGQPPQVALVAHIQTAQRRLTPAERQEAGDDLAGIPAVTPEEGAGPVNPALKDAASDAPEPRVTFQILDRNLYPVIPSTQINGGKSFALPKGGRGTVEVPLTEDVIKKLVDAPLNGRFYVQILPLTVATQYGITVPESVTPQTTLDDLPVSIAVATPAGIGHVPPALGGGPDTASILFRGRTGTFGQQIKGGAEQSTPVGVYTFRNADVRPGRDNTVEFELRSGIERSGDSATESDDLTDVKVQVLDASLKPVGEPITVHPESLRTTYFDVPHDQLGNGNFSIAIRSNTPGHWVGLSPTSLQLVVASNSFGYNLFKSLLILWLMSVLVVVVSVFTSTFLSWPIAIVLTVVILLGRWGVEQLGDATGSGIGNQVATDLGFQDPSKAKVVSTTVEGLSKMLNTVSAVLPDISKFEASEDVERGVTLSRDRVFQALGVVGGFGIPLLVLSYIFLKNKEVAP